MFKKKKKKKTIKPKPKSKNKTIIGIEKKFKNLNIIEIIFLT